MSIPGKVEYGGAPSTFNLQCVKGLDPQTAQYIADQFNQLNQAIYLLGNPHRVQDGASVPPTHPPRNRVRFKLTASLSGGSATAVAVDGDGTDLSGAPTFTVYDPMGRYASAGSGDYGIASYVEYPGDTYRLEIDVLGGEGTVTGTANDELVAVDSTDASNGNAGWLVDKIQNQSTPKPGSGVQTVSYAVVDKGGGDYALDFYTTTGSATETHRVKVSTSDTGPNFLKESVATTPQNYVDTGAFNGDNHQKVYFVVEGSGDEKFSLRTKRSEDTGKVKQTEEDSLGYLNEKFDDYDDANLMDTTDNHDKVLVGPQNDEAGGASTGIPLQLYVKDPRVVCEANDLAEYLPDQFIDLVETSYDTNNHTPVKFVKEAASPDDMDLRAYIEFKQEEITYVTSVSCTDGVLSYETATKTFLVAPEA